MTKLTSTLPGGDNNGLAAIAHDLVTDPHKVHVAIVLLDCKRITEDADSGETVPTARIRRIEPIDGQDKDLAAQMLRRALEERTGQAVLPLDLENELEGIFADVDPDQPGDGSEQ